MKALKCCKINFLQIRTNWKYWICLAFVVLQMWSITGDMGAYAQALHYPHVAPWLLPHLPAFIQKYTVLLIIFLVLVSDAPFRTAQQQLVIQRVGKRKWIIGQLLFLFAMSVLYSLLLWLLSWIFYAPMVEWTPEWGKVIFSSTNYDLTSGITEMVSPVIITKEILMNTTGLAATAHMVLVQALVCFFLGGLILICNLWLRSGVGPFLSGTFVMEAFFLRANAMWNDHPTWLTWASPVSWVDRSMMDHTNQGLPSSAYGLWMIAALCLAEVLVVVGTIHKCDIAAKE